MFSSPGEQWEQLADLGSGNTRRYWTKLAANFFGVVPPLIYAVSNRLVWTPRTDSMIDLRKAELR